MKIKPFLINMLKGGAIGAAMIIPGVSGGTLAVLLNVYDKLINAVGDLRKDFKNSFLFLLPVLLGAAIAVAALLVPLNYALTYAYLPTVLLFMGLMCGSCPKMIKDARANGWKKTDILSVALPFAVVIGICFIPGIGNVDLTGELPAYIYVALIAMGMLTSCALVIPGISGSMLLMIFGFYEPIVSTFKMLFETPLQAMLILALFAVGLIAGFFTIAKIMQILLKKFPRVTFWAIVGFVLGSIPAILIVFFNDAGAVSAAVPWQIAVGCILFILGAAATFFLIRFTEQKIKAENSDTENL